MVHIGLCKQCKIANTLQKFAITRTINYTITHIGYTTINHALFSFLQESIIIDDHLRSHSTSDIPDHQTIPPQPLQAPDPNLSRLSSTESNNAEQTPPQSMRSYSHSYSEASTRPSSSSVPIPRQRPRPLTLQLSSPQTHSRRIEPRNGSESPSSLPSSGSFGSVVSFGLGVSFGIALCSFFFSK